MNETHLRASDYYVTDVPVAIATQLVTAHHYARGGPNTATFAHGLFRHGDALHCLGVAWWIPPTRSCAEASWPGGDWRQVLSLSRLVIVPGMPTNAASFLIGQSIKAIRSDGRWRCLITYADEWQGHTGAIYRATNWEYLGTTKAEATFVDPQTGRMVSRKAGPRTRNRAEMAALGYTCIGRFRKHKYRLLLPEGRQARNTQLPLWAA